MNHLNACLKCSIYLVIGVGLFACGGGGGNTDSVDRNQPYQQGVFVASSAFKSFCESPRNGINPETNEPYGDVQGRTLDENNWLRSWSNETYLWYDEIIDQDPGLYNSPLDYFEVLKTEQLTASGNPKDNFHFTLPTDEWLAFSRSGVSASYGARFIGVNNSVPRKLLVAYVQPGSPADVAGFMRGTEVLSVDGIDLVNTNNSEDIAALNEALSPGATGERHQFIVQHPNTNTSQTIELVSVNLNLSPVLDSSVISTASGNVAYVVFNDHIATAEQQLLATFSQLKTANITDLVLDLRYNGGGFLAIASQLAYMIAGSASAGKTFELTQFNDKYPDTNPITGEPIEPLPFVNQTVGFSVPQGQLLPSLELGRVFILTSGNTCSASESLINGLRGIDIDVIQIGSTTCGKPYGFFAEDNCGTTYFTIQLTGVNNKGFGGFADGFSPDNALVNIGEPVTGCVVPDDFAHALGDTNERMLAEALHYRMAGQCLSAPTIVKPAVGVQKLQAKPDVLNNKVVPLRAYKTL